MVLAVRRQPRAPPRWPWAWRVGTKVPGSRHQAGGNVTQETLAFGLGNFLWWERHQAGGNV